MRAVYKPEGFNLGWNIGRIAGAGIPDHGHLHVVPRWGGDTNFMPVLGDVKVMPEHLPRDAKLAAAWPRPATEENGAVPAAIPLCRNRPSARMCSFAEPEVIGTPTDVAL